MFNRKITRNITKKKKHFTLLCALLLSALCALTVTSCGDDEPTPAVIEQGGINNGNNGDENYGKLRAGDYVATGSHTDLSLWRVVLLCSVDKAALGENALKSSIGVVISTDKASLKNSGRFVKTSGVTDGRYEVVVDFLRPETTYYYCACVSTSGGSTSYATDVCSFTTGSLTLETGEAVNVTWFTADIACRVSAEQMATAGEFVCGAMLSVDGDPDINHYDERGTTDNIGSGDYVVPFTNLRASTTYNYRSYVGVRIDGKREYYYGGVKQFTTQRFVYTAVAVDLGLPSGIKWASYNLGANSPEEYGEYFAWGETEPKKDYSWSTYLTSLGGSMTIGSIDCGTSKDPLRDYVYGGNKYSVASKAGVADGIGGTEYDAARMKLGGKWRMPTKAEQRELLDRCTWSWTSKHGVYGYEVQGPSGKSIFLPPAGYRYGTDLRDAGSSGLYWSSTAYSGYAYYAYYLRLHFPDWDDELRYVGLPVRPVSE